MNNKNLCLDIGNVICKINFNPFIDLLSKHLNITREDVWYFLNRVQKLHDMGLTQMEDELKDHFKIKSPVIINELIDTWNKTLIPNTDIINFINEYSSTNKIEIALLSNIGFEHADWFNNNVIINNSIKYFSCFVGARKPSFIYYQSFLQMYPQFKECIYLDDNTDNLNSSLKNGLSGRYFNLQDYKDDDILNALQGFKSIIC
jgi:hypothetical protein